MGLSGPVTISVGSSMPRMLPIVTEAMKITSPSSEMRFQEASAAQAATWAFHSFRWGRARCSQSPKPETKSLAGCGRGFFQSAEREPWRAEAEIACLKSGAVKESPDLVRIDPIEGPGVCGAEFPLKVAALGDSSSNFGFADEDLRPPAALGGQQFADGADVQAQRRLRDALGERDARKRFGGIADRDAALDESAHEPVDFELERFDVDDVQRSAVKGGEFAGRDAADVRIGARCANYR